MSMDSIDLRNRWRFHCPDCQEELHPESEEYSISRANDKSELCEDCQKLENANNLAMELSNG